MERQIHSRQANRQAGGAPRRIVTSRELLGDGRELVIVHAGEEYRLRITSNEKLILTK
jgi:hemin uptake protein HemP